MHEGTASGLVSRSQTAVGEMPRIGRVPDPSTPKVVRLREASYLMSWSL